MAIDKDELLRTLRTAQVPMSASELLSQIGLHPGERTELKRVLRDLTREGLLSREGKRFAIAGKDAVPVVVQPRKRRGGAREVEEAGRTFAEKLPPPVLVPPRRAQKGRYVVGTLTRHRDGFGFVAPLFGDQEDVFLPAHEAEHALDGDLIKVEVVAGRGGRSAGRFVDLVERRRIFAIGTYVQHGRHSYVIPTDASLPDRFDVPWTSLAADGDLVKIRITALGTRDVPARAEIVERMGQPGEPKAEALEVALSYGFFDQFPPEVEADARSVPDRVLPEEARTRRDLRELRLVTIDGEDARDFDDAVYVERLKTGFRLVVAIADVSHYVRPGRPLDDEALRRATSVYFPQMVLPMLPERLSNGICSLNPDEDRLCMVADIIMATTEEGTVRVVDAELYEGLMRSHARCTYDEVARVLSGEKVPHREHLRGDFEAMEELARRLMRMREERGAIDFDLPEVKPVLDEDYRPVRIALRERNIAHRIIEEFMLAANEAVARYFTMRNLPTVFRIHGEPHPEKLQLFLNLADAHGHTLPLSEVVSGKDLNRLLKQLTGRPEQQTLNMLMLRSMMQAVYSPENVGHFGLAAENYLHFTSPIRRYPDLVVHRLLKAHWARGMRTLTDQERAREEEQLEAIAARCSERERAAMDAEREVDDYYEALYMQDKIGEEYQARVVSVTGFGMFVHLEEEHVEGLVKAEDLGDGGQLDEQRHRLIFPDGLSFGLGDRVRVRLTSVNVARRQIEFELVTLPTGEPFFPRGSASRGVPPLSRRRVEAPGVVAPQRRRRQPSPAAETFEAERAAPAGRRTRTGVGSRESSRAPVEKPASAKKGRTTTRAGAASSRPAKGERSASRPASKKGTSTRTSTGGVTTRRSSSTARKTGARTGGGKKSGGSTRRK